MKDVIGIHNVKVLTYNPVVDTKQMETEVSDLLNQDWIIESVNTVTVHDYGPLTVFVLTNFEVVVIE